jgi:hypothetical protein
MRENKGKIVVLHFAHFLSVSVAMAEQKKEQEEK